jgi:hypothetical protein
MALRSLKNLDLPNLEDKASVFMPPEIGWPRWHRVSLLVASYDTQGHGGVILLCPHTENIYPYIGLYVYGLSILELFAAPLIKY